MRARLVVLAVLPVVVAGGCYVFAPTSLDGFFEASIRARCHFVFDCCSAGERTQFFQNAFNDEGSCVSQQLESQSGTAAIAERARAVVAANKGDFNAKRAEECVKPGLDAENNCDADTVLSGKPVADGLCGADAERGFVEGKTKDGDDCDDDIECADFGVCDRSNNDVTIVSIKGSCVAALKEGKSCFDAATGTQRSCVPGLDCKFDGNSGTCQKIVLKDDGASCVQGGECKNGFCSPREIKKCFDDTPCTVDADCGAFQTCNAQPASVCSGDAPKIEICQPKK